MNQSRKHLERIAHGTRALALGRGTPLLILIASVILYWPSYSWLGTEWGSGSLLFSHGYLLAALAVCSVVRDALTIPELELSPNHQFSAALVVLSFLWLLAYIADVVVVHTALVPLLALTALGAVYGSRLAKHFAFSVLFIVFALPAWYYLQPIFREITIFVIEVSFNVFGIPVEVSGNRIHVPGGTFRIIDGCSGINFIVVALALSSLYGHLYYTTRRAKLLLILTGLGLALLTNWVRVVSIALVGNFTNMTSGLIEDHGAYGWWLFAAALVPLFIIARRLETVEGDYLPLPVASTTMATPLPSLLAAMVMMSIGPVWAMAVSPEPIAGKVVSVRLPQGQGEWQGPVDSLISWRPLYAGASGEELGEYTAGATSVFMYKNVYLTQEQDRELVHISNDVAGGFRGKRTTTGLVRVTPSESIRVKVHTAVHGNQTWLIWSWYEVDGAIMSNDMFAKLWQAISTMQGRTVAGLTAIATRCKVDCQEASATLREFVLLGLPTRVVEYEANSLET